MKNKKNHQLNMRQVIIASLFLMPFIGSTCQEKPDPDNGGEKFSIKLIKDEKIQVSPNLLGFNIVYAYEADSIWSDGKIEGYLKDVYTSVMRYPGGTVSSYYHWNELTGEGWKDSWDPENPVKSKAESAFMDLNEFISLARKTGVTPLLGINMSSGWRWNRLEDGVREALELMKYCRDNNFNVKYWYLDNEPYQPDSNGGSKTIEEYAGLVNLFAARMKEFDPDIEIIVNWNSAFKNRNSEYQKLLSIAGNNIDIIDGHWYWSWSNPTFDKWLLNTPMQVWTGGSYLAEIEYFRQMVKEFGYPDIKLASLEWNVGPVKDNQLTSHQCALIQSEMLMQFMTGGLDMATFWPIQGAGTALAPRNFVNRNDRSAQPVYKIFKFLGKVQGGDIFKAEVITDLANVLYFVSADETGDNIRVCFLNKNMNNIRVDIETDLFEQMELIAANAFVLKNQGTGSDNLNVELLKHTGTGISFVSPYISLTMLTFKKI